MELIIHAINILSRKRKIFIYLFLFLSIFFISRFFLIDRTYISTTKLAYNSDDSSSTVLGSNIGRLIGGMGSMAETQSVSSTTNTFDMIPEVLTAYSFLDKILDKKFIIDNKSKTLFMMYSKDKEGDIARFNARKTLSKKIIITKSLSRPTISISFLSNNPNLSYEVLSSMFEQLKSDLTNFRLQRIEERLFFIDNQINATKQELDILENDLRDFRINNSKILQSPNLRMEESKKVRDITVLSNTYSSLRIEFEMTKIKKLEESNVLQIIDPPNIPERKSSPSGTYHLIYIIVSFIFLSFIYILFQILISSKEFERIRRHLDWNNINNAEKNKESLY